MSILDRNGKPISGANEQKGTSLKVSPPQNLPVQPMAYSVPVYLEGLAVGRQWPPPRVSNVVARFQMLYEAASGVLGQWYPQADNPKNRWPWVLEMYQAVLTDVPPEAAGESLATPVNQAIEQMLLYGRSLLVRFDEGLVVPDMRFAHPMGDTPGAWLTAVPEVGRDSSGGEPTRMRFTIYVAGQAVTTVRNISAGLSETAVPRFTLLDNAEGAGAVPAQTAVADRGTPRYGWGTSHVEELIGHMVAFAQIEELAEFTLRSSAIRTAVISGSSARLSSYARQLTGAPPVRTPSDHEPATPDELQRMMRLVEGSVIVSPDEGIQLDYPFPEADITALMEYADRQEMLWTQKTGLAPVELADSADVSSAAAIARRQAAFVARAKQMHFAVEDPLRDLYPELDWEWVDTLGEAEDDGTSDRESPDPR